MLCLTVKKIFFPFLGFGRELHYGTDVLETTVQLNGYALNTMFIQV